MNRKQLTDAADRLAELRAQQPAPERSTSAAKDVDPDGLKGTALENAPDVRRPFQRAAEQSQERVSAAQDNPTESQQVKDTGQHLQLDPPPEISRKPDREKHQAEMTRDDQAAREASKRALLESLKAREDQQEPGLSQGGMDRSM